MDVLKYVWHPLKLTCPIDNNRLHVVDGSNKWDKLIYSVTLGEKIGTPSTKTKW